jgi:hypothetical protein
MMMMDTQIREQTLSILLKNFGSTHSPRAIYECADEWCKKQVTTAGLVSYFAAYYGKKLINEGQQSGQKNNQKGKKTS